MDEPDKVLRLMSALTTPLTKGTVERSEKGHVVSFESILRESMKELRTLLMQDRDLEEIAPRFSSEGDDAHWQFVTVCLTLLKLLNESMQVAVRKFEESLNECYDAESSGAAVDDADHRKSSKRKQNQAPPDVLSVAQQKTLSSVIQFIVCLGVSPCLSPGVGVPVELRSSFGQHLKSYGKTFETVEKVRRLSLCVDTLQQCVLHPSFGSLVLSLHLNDLLAALLQLCHGYVNHPSKTSDVMKYKSSGQVSTDLDCRLRNMDLTTASPGTVVTALQQDNADSTKSTDKLVVASKVLSDESLSLNRRKYEESLKDLVQRIYPPMLVRELLMLQGGPRQPPKKNQQMPTLVPAPPWLRRVCGRLLSEQVMKPLGVHHVLRGILGTIEGADGSSTSDGTATGDDWKKCNAIARIIANCPRMACSVEDYYRLICPQVLELLHIKDLLVARQFVRVACSIVSAMMKQYPALCQKYLIKPLLHPLKTCLDLNDDVLACESSNIWLTEESLALCVEDIYKVCVTAQEPKSSLLMCLMPVISVLFKLLCFCKKGVSQLRSACQDIVTTFLKCIEKSIAFEVLKALAFGTTPVDASITNVYHNLHPALKFVPGDSGGVAVISSPSTSVESEESDSEVHVSCIVAILKELQKDGLAGEFFLFFLEELTKVISEEDHVVVDRDKSTGSRGKDLLNIEHEQEALQENFNRRLVIMTLLIKMCETIDHTYLTSARHVIKFARATLLRSIYIIEHTEDVQTGVFESETITLAIGLLTATMTGAVEIKPDDRERMKELLPLLDEITIKHPHEEVKDMATDIKIAIATYGAVWTDSLASAAKKFSKSEDNVPKKAKGKTPKLIEELKSEKKKLNVDSDKEERRGLCSTEVKPVKTIPNVFRNGAGAISGTPHGAQVKFDSEQSSEIETDVIPQDPSLLGQCLNELCSPMIPIRGHALITLAKLIQQKDSATLQKQELLLSIFKENIAHDDSYIYLAAINGLAGLAETNPRETVPVLAAEFVGVVGKNSKTRAAELRMKLGEVLMKVSRSLGDVIPQYRDVLIHAFLTGCKDTDDHIRASSLSNLGQLCQLLRFSLGNILQEVFQCTSALLKSDPAVEVRRAAVMVITMTFRGVGQDALLILKTVLGDIYRSLKLSYTTEKDDVVKLHTQLALEELDKIMKIYLFPKQSLKKTIYVADNPNQ